MFNFFKKNPTNVIAFPEIKDYPKMPYVEPPAEPEKPIITYYRLGLTNNGRVSFQMGQTEITMNSDGINNMIKQLEVFRDQIMEYENDPTDDPDGGEPVPVPEQEQRAA